MLKKIINECKTNHENTVNKIMKITYEEFIEQIRYLFRYNENGPIHIIHEYFDDHILDIEKKSVNELTENERLILMIHWAYENEGFDKYRFTPFSIIEHLTDAEILKEINRRINSRHHSIKIETNITCRRNEE